MAPAAPSKFKVGYAPDADIEYRDLGLSAATAGQIGALTAAQVGVFTTTELSTLTVAQAGALTSPDASSA